LSLLDIITKCFETNKNLIKLYYKVVPTIPEDENYSDCVSDIGRSNSIFKNDESMDQFYDNKVKSPSRSQTGQQIENNT
jgi:hypothetical protein